MYIYYANSFLYVLQKNSRNKLCVRPHDTYFLFRTFFSQVNNKYYAFLVRWSIPLRMGNELHCNCCTNQGLHCECFTMLKDHGRKRTGKAYKSGTFIEACYDIFFKWNNRVRYHKWGTGTIFKKYYCNDNLNYRQNMLPINLNNNKYWTCELCSFFIRSELKCEPHENTVCVFLMWTDLKI